MTVVRRMYKSQESGLFEYATSKTMKLMLSRELNKRLKVCNTSRLLPAVTASAKVAASICTQDLAAVLHLVQRCHFAGVLSACEAIRLRGHFDAT